MGTVPLQILKKIAGAEKLIAVVCIAASLIGAGFVFFGGLLSDQPARQVILVSADLNQSYFTEARTVGAFLDEIGFDYTDHDLITPSPETPIRPGLTISFAHANMVSVADAGGEPVSVLCPGETVCDLINQLGISVSPLDRVTPYPSTPLSEGLEVVITRVEVVDITARREIEPELVIEADPNLPRGRMEEVNPGVAGIAEDITRYYYRNGQETAQVDIGSRVVSEPQSRVARVGVRSMPQLASRGGVQRDVMIMVATAYDPGPISCGAYADGYTATGHVATRGVCAVDPRVIPLGTELWIEGYGYALACDVGGAIKGNRIDVCFDTYQEAIRWGRKTVLVYILE